MLKIKWVIHGATSISDGVFVELAVVIAPASWLSLHPNELARLGANWNCTQMSWLVWEQIEIAPKRAGSSKFKTQTSQLVWVQFQFDLKRAGSFEVKLSQVAGGAKKTPFFGGFLPIFRPVPCFWTGLMYIKCPFCKRNQSNRPCLAAGVPFTKFRRV